MGALNKDDFILVTGGNGFIGSHVAARLLREGYRVRVVDLQPPPTGFGLAGAETVIADLGDHVACQKVVRGVTAVLHFAAVMGGMGVIHSANDLPIYNHNHSMTKNLVSASLTAGVRFFFYASSACVYPDRISSVDDDDLNFAEKDVWANGAPRPQGLYGLEKLAAEDFLRHLHRGSSIDVRIARFHNVYGPGGAWSNGREKAPAALLRKALAAKLAGDPSPTMEIWGDGKQRRSFLWIEDCVDAVLKLITSDCAEPVNIGSDQAVTIDELARMAVKAAGIDTEVSWKYVEDRPLGVASRNSDNGFVTFSLGWKPQTSLLDGMATTAHWMLQEMKRCLDGLDAKERRRQLLAWQSSKVVDLQSSLKTFAILLPVTSRGSVDCLKNLATFARSLIRTTWRDCHPTCGRFRLKVYLAIDHDDEDLLTDDRGMNALKDEGLYDVVQILSHRPRGHVCAIWRESAKRAWEDNCEYFVLMGDDVETLDEGWMRDCDNAFHEMSVMSSVEGLGCIAFTDVTFPGMPTFPIIHRTHLDIFGGNVIPDTFINQDGDPYLFQLYRRFGCSRMLDFRIRNNVGGSVAARYEKRPLQNWTFRPLDNGTLIIERWMAEHGHTLERKLTLDVIVPSFRVQVPLLENILRLQSSPTCSVMFIIIIDNPNSPHVLELENKYGHRPDVRIRTHTTNKGASATRNKGLQESSGEWVHFLDDDIVPESNLLIEAERAIRSHPTAAGFVGNVQFPKATSIATSAIHLAGVTYFWDIATKMAEDIPWGVTANLIARRSALGMEDEPLTFDTVFPKTGGGEDIDFCLKSRAASLRRGGQGFRGAPNVMVTHPWWNGGNRSYKRFFMWAKGDGALVAMWPQHTYIHLLPNGGEAILISACITIAGLLYQLWDGDVRLAKWGICSLVASTAAGVVYDFYRHLWLHPERNCIPQYGVSGPRWLLAIAESSLIRVTSEVGRIVGMIGRGEYQGLGHRFDWFTDRLGSGPRAEQAKSDREATALWVCFLGALLYL